MMANNDKVNDSKKYLDAILYSFIFKQNLKIIALSMRIFNDFI